MIAIGRTGSWRKSARAGEFLLPVCPVGRLSPRGPILDEADPAEMGSEIEGSFHLIQLARPGRLVGNDFDVTGAEGDKIPFAQAEAVPQEPELLPVEPHEPGRDAIDGDGMGAREDHAAGLRIRGHRSVAFAADDSVNHGEIAQGLVARLPVAVLLLPSVLLSRAPVPVAVL